MPEPRRQTLANYRVTHMATGAHVDVTALDGKQARARGAAYLSESEEDLEVRALPFYDPIPARLLPLPMEQALHAADGETACWSSDKVRAYALENIKSRSDAELVMAALDTGNWVLRRMLPSSYFTEEANRAHAWIVERQTAPYCAVYGPKDPRGMYGMRSWSAPTALGALQKAADDLGIPLIPPAEVKPC